MMRKSYILEREYHSISQVMGHWSMSALRKLRSIGVGVAGSELLIE